MIAVLINIMLKCRTSLRFWDNKDWINEINPYGWFQWYSRYWLVWRSKDDERQRDRWKQIVVNFTIIQFRLKLDKLCCIGVMN